MTLALFTLGGTIAMAGHTSADPGAPVVARLTGADLTAAVPGLETLELPLDVRDIEAVPSSARVPAAGRSYGTRTAPSARRPT